MSKPRRKFIAVLAVLLCAILTLNTAFIISNKTANAAYSASNFNILGKQEDGTYADLWIGGENPINGNLLDELYKAITGQSGATYQTVKDKLDSSSVDGNGYHYLTSDDIRTVQKSLGNTVGSNGKNISIWFGGIKWDVVYLTTDKSSNVILDLWQSAGDEFAVNKAYACFGENKPNVTYPSNMYSTSYARVEVLNAGGYTAKNNNALNDKHDPQEDNDYAKFTIETVEDSLTPYIVKPNNVKYQENESAIGNHTPASGVKASQCPNDAYGTNMTGWYDSYTNYEGKGSNDGKPETNYEHWQNDFLWLPSLAETGNADGTGNGIWKTDANLRSSFSGVSWLRSGYSASSNNYAAVACLSTSGGYGYTPAANTPYQIRAALHLNLTKAAENASRLLTVPEKVSREYTSKEQKLDNIEIKPDWYVKDLYEDSSIISVSYPTDGRDMLDVGTYAVKVTISDEAKSKYRWADSTDYKTDTERSFTYEITKKKLEVTLTTQDNKPVAKLDPDEICENDSLEDIEKLLYFTYKSKEGQNYDKTFPTVAGDYIATVHIENCNYSIEEKTIPFTVPKQAGSFNPATDIKWVYDNGSSTNVAINETPFKIPYNGSEFVIKLDATALLGKGVKVKENSYVDNTGEVVGKHTAKVTLEASSAQYADPEPNTFTLSWEITQAKYDLSKLRWNYTAGSLVYNESDQIVTIDPESLPTGLTVPADGYSNNKFKNATPDGDYYEASIIKFESSNNNYVFPQIANPDTYEGNPDNLKLQWRIEKKPLAPQWLGAENKNYQDTVSGEFFWLPVAVNDENKNFEVKYYKEDDFDLVTLRPKDTAVAVDPSEMRVSHDNPETYYAVAFLKTSMTANYTVDLSKGYVRFTVGDNKITVALSLEKEFTFDNLGHGTLDEVEIDTASSYFNSTYLSVKWYEYDAGATNHLGKELSEEPVNVGKYVAVFAVLTEYDADYAIEGSGIYEYEIKTLVLDAPQLEDELTYDGTERDVAQLCGLPEGWKNYLEISIIRQGEGSLAGYTVKNVGTYTVTFKIKSDIAAGNVVWSDTSKPSRTLEITIKQLVLHAKSWDVDGYYTELVFDEDNAEQFVYYTVKDENGEVVDESTFYSSKDKTFTVEVAVGAAHGDNVTIEFANGISAQYKFSANGNGNDGNNGGDDSADLENKKQAAKDALEQAAKDKKDEIDKSDMTDEEKAEAKKKVEEELAAGNAAIDSATDENGIASAEGTYTTNIKNISTEHIESSSFPWWIIALVAGVLALLAVLIIIIVKRRQTADGEDEYDDYYDDEYDFEEEEYEEDNYGGDEDF